MDRAELPLADDDLVAHIRAGESAAFAAMVRAHASALHAYLTRMLRDSTRAEDILQDLMLRVWITRETLQPAGPLRAYLFRAARNRVLDERRHGQVVDDILASGAGKAVDEAPDTAASPLERIEQHDMQDAVQRAVAALPPRCREIFRLSREDGLGYGEIAHVLEISVNTVKTQMGIALRALRTAALPFLTLTVALTR